MPQEEITLATVMESLDRIQRKLADSFLTTWDYRKRMEAQRVFIIATLRALGPDQNPPEVDWDSDLYKKMCFEFQEPILIGFRTDSWKQNISSTSIVCRGYGMEVKKRFGCFFALDSEKEKLGHFINCFDSFFVSYEDIFIIGRHFNPKDPSLFP